MISKFAELEYMLAIIIMLSLSFILPYNAWDIWINAVDAEV